MHEQVSPVASFQWWSVKLAMLQDRLLLYIKHYKIYKINTQSIQSCANLSQPVFMQYIFTYIYSDFWMKRWSPQEWVEWTSCLGGQELHRDGQILLWNFTLWVHRLDHIFILGWWNQSGWKSTPKSDVKNFSDYPLCAKCQNLSMNCSNSIMQLAV